MDVNEYVLWNHIGQCIKRARETKGATQDQLAFAVGLTRTSVTNAELGRQRLQLSTMYKICRALDIALSDLLPAPDDIVTGEPFTVDPVSQRIAELESELDKLRKTNR